MESPANATNIGGERIEVAVENEGALEVVTPSRRVQANRTNALRSSGPRSAVGKGRSRWNALKHGVLAREVVSRNDGEEFAEFRHLLAELRRDSQPVTTLEELLVERVASCYWRLGRVVRAETAAIESRIDNAHLGNEQEARQRAFELDDDSVEAAERLCDLPGIESVLEVVRAAQAEFEAVGSLDGGAIVRFEQVVGHAFCGMERPEGRVSRAAEEQRKTEVLHALAMLEGDLESLRSRLAEREARAVERAPRMLAVPDAATATRLLQYESAIERQLYKALHELERLQRIRAGEAVPPRLHVHVEAVE